MTDATSDAPAAEGELESFSARFARFAAEFGDRTAVVLRPERDTEGESLTFAELDRRGNAMARHLASLGAGEGSFVTVAEPNSLEFLVACLGCWRIGAIPQPVSSRLPRLELDAIIELADAAAVVGVAGDADHGRPVVPRGFRPGPDVDDSPLPDIVSSAWKAPTSGGSTGRPKLIVSGDPSSVARMVESTFPAIGARRGAIMTIPGPLYHNGPFIWTWQTLLSGGEVVLLPRFDAVDTLAAIDEHRATSCYLVPTMMQRMWKLPDDVKARYDLSSLEIAVHLAEPCPPWLKEVWIDWIGPDVLWELYGGTEGQASTLLSGAEWLEHRGSVGRPLAGEITILDDDGNPVEPGTVGDVWMRPVGRDRPTYRYVGADAETHADGWECLGDIGWMDADGYLYLADRRKDMILVGGANVFPAEVEAAIAAHDGVASCCVIGLPDEDKGHRVHAIIQPDAAVGSAEGAIDVDELRSFLAERLVTYKLPRTFEFVDEPLRDDAGKVRRAQLTDERIAALETAAPETAAPTEETPA